MSSKYADNAPVYTTHVPNAKYHVQTLTDFLSVNDVTPKDHFLTVTICVIAGCFTGVLFLLMKM